jgi:hypothetical protein
MPVAPVHDGKAWQAGTSASVITTGPSVVRNLDWDQGPERRPKSIIEAKPKRKPVPPPKELKKKTFSQYLPYLLPQHHSAEVIELGKAQEQVYQRPTYKPAGWTARSKARRANTTKIWAVPPTAASRLGRKAWQT